MSYRARVQYEVAARVQRERVYGERADARDDVGEVGEAWEPG